MSTPSTSDIPRDGWVDRLAPRWSQPYIRLSRFDRPIGAWLLLFPCWWSIALASGDQQDIIMFLLFCAGAGLMRGGGCTWNDILDRDFDAQVARTRDRPLPAGEVTVRQAFAWFVLQLALAALILFSFNGFAIATGLASLALLGLYPLAKRVTFWPQFVLGLAFNWGALLGWAAVQANIGLPAIILYVGGIFWTLGYDTIYAHQDRPDDPGAGIKSSARALGLMGSKPWLYGFYLAAIVFFGFAGYMASLSWPFWIGLAAGAAQLVWQVSDADLDDPKNCLSKFKSNGLFGWLLLAGIIVGQLTNT
ncbi:MAG: 4-hydroxybenzoate octaprenyltransferase [Pseudomonadota bacterium]|nr:4-hydroxybenzoate octaprenyltransferase [Pseudomonadota bacterium]